MAATRQEDLIGPQSSPLVSDAESYLASSLYQEFHRLAAAKVRFERGNHTLKPTALVHEAYLRMADCSASMWGDGARVLSLATHVMRNILVDSARAYSADKRGDAALTRLATFDRRPAYILELHFFAGLTFEEIAWLLGISTRTVKRDWTMAHAWLYQELAPIR